MNRDRWLRDLLLMGLAYACVLVWLGVQWHRGQEHGRQRAAAVVEANHVHDR